MSDFHYRHAAVARETGNNGQQQPPAALQQRNLQMKKKKKKVGKRNITVFYHTFANPNKKRKQKVKPHQERENPAAVTPAVMSANQTRSIAMEQIRQVSAAVRELDDEESYQWVLRYVTVGEEGVVSEAWVDSLCFQFPHFRCEYVGHEAVGQEEVTLQRLHNHCRNNHPDDLVVYIHTKGTFHATEANNRWRKLLTTAALKSSCIRALEDRQCSVCGLQYYPIWISFFPGNMFSARCDYVQKLVDVTEHANQMSSIVDHVMKSNKVWSRRLYEWRRDALGIGRFSREAWVTSHPDLVPCDLARQTTRLYQSSNSESSASSSSQGWQDLLANQALPAPRVPIEQGEWERFVPRKFFHLLEQGNIAGPDTTTVGGTGEGGGGRHEYFLLPGHLLRFWRIYHQFPPHDSWMWNWFPHGKEWRHKIEHLPPGDWNESVLFS